MTETTTVIATRLETPPGMRFTTASTFLWQMEEQRRTLIEDTRGLTPEDLLWQPAPGMNTIGMLLAHIAFAEAHMIQVGVLNEPVGHAHDVVGFTEEQEGLPLAPGAPPSPVFDGKDLAYFDDVLARTHAFTRGVVSKLTDADLMTDVTRPRRPDGTQRVFNKGWVVYHLIEHEAQHRGQINLLKHMRRVTAGGGA